MAGNVAVHSLTKEQILALMPYNAQVESLVRSIRHLLAENLRESHALLDEFQKFFEQKLGKKPIDMGKSDGMIKLEDIGKEIAR